MGFAPGDRYLGFAFALAFALAQWAPAALPAGNVVGIARIEGPVGFRSGSDYRAFDQVTVRDVVAEARMRGCDTLMIDLNSPGGSVSVGEKVIDELQKAQGAGLRIVVWYEMAGSAASWIPFSCKTAVVRPGGTCGGSVIWAYDANGKPTAVDAKMASFTIGRVKSAAGAAQRPLELVDAIFEQDREVWVDSSGALSGQRPTDPAAKCIDSSTSVLNMDASTAVALGFAKGTANDRDSAAKLAGLAPVRWVDLSGKVEARSRQIRVKDKEARAAVRAWCDAVERLGERIVDAIDCTKESAAAYERGDTSDGKLLQLGRDARKRLSAHMVALTNAAGKLRFDEALLPESAADAAFRANWEAVQKTIEKHVKEIRAKLEVKPSSKGAMSAVRDAERLFDDLEPQLKRIPKPKPE